MPAPATDLPSPPPHVAARLPAPMPARQALLASVRTCRPASSWCARPGIRPRCSRAGRRSYRFGPPDAWRREAPSRFHWIYAAADEMTAVWEAGLCRNDVTDPGTFYVAAGRRGGADRPPALCRCRWR